MGRKGIFAPPAVAFRQASSTLARVMKGVKIRSDTSVSASLAFRVPGSHFSFWQTLCETFPMGTSQPMIQLTQTLSAREISHPGRVKCPESSIPARDWKKLRISPMIILMQRPADFIRAGSGCEENCIRELSFSLYVLMAI